MNYTKFGKLRASVFFLSWVSVASAASLYLVGKSDWSAAASALAAVFFAVGFALRNLYASADVVQSHVGGFTGACVPTWVNLNQVHRKLDGGTTGFFRLAKKIPYLPLYFCTGKEFHGKVTGAVVIHADSFPNYGTEFNIEGTLTGRFNSDEPQFGNSPKCA